MESAIQPLRIAFMGYSADLTKRFLRQFCEDNRESIRSISDRKIILTDETRIIPISPAMVSERLVGYCFDQMILADDGRKMIYVTYCKEISLFRKEYMPHSYVPEDFQIQFYNIDASIKEEKTNVTR